MNSIFIPTYIINLEERRERLNNILKEFEGRDEFAINVINAVKNNIGAYGLWLSFQKIVHQAISNQDDVIIICEDDHQFTNDYNKDYLINNIIEAGAQGCDILCGGISGNFDGIHIPISKNRFWISEYWCNQFIVVYKSMFDRILAHEFDKKSKVDLTMSQLSGMKNFLFPFISTQKIYDYSDVTEKNNIDQKWLNTRFSYFNEKLSAMHKLFNFYNSF